MYSEPDLDTMQRVRCSFDPDNIANPINCSPVPGFAGKRRANILLTRWRQQGRRVLLINTQDMTAPLAAVIGAEHLLSSGGTSSLPPATQKRLPRSFAWPMKTVAALGRGAVAPSKVGAIQWRRR